MMKFKFLSKEPGSKVHHTSFIGIVVDDTGSTFKELKL